jgi:isochorismate synthase EntC
MASSKDRSEHWLVVQDITRRLEPVTHELTVAEHPSLRKLAHVQHLSSEIVGTLSEDLSVIEVAGLIHPTPAVGGSPGPESLALISKLEDMDRGWYAGGLGWRNGDGSGEIAVALRCALLRGPQAYVYAGSGIVADSDPYAELEETRLKFRTIMRLLAES